MFGLIVWPNRSSAMSQLLKGGNMKTKKQLIVCLAVCFVLSFISSGYAGSNVTIDNSNIAPVPVTEVRQQPIAKEVTFKICAPCGVGGLPACVPPCTFISPGWYGNATIHTVPPDKYLIIEYFSCKDQGNGTSFGSYSNSYSFGISTRTAGVSVDHYLPTTPYGHPQISVIEQGYPNPPAFMSAGQRVQLFADSGSDVIVEAWRQSNYVSSWVSDELIVCSFSGYLLNEVLVPIIGIRNPKK
jgi:hypothetical protein